MGVEIQRNYFTYTADDGDSYSVKLASDIGAITELGFSAFSASNPRLPAGFRMRHVCVTDTATGRTRRYPVGALASDVWTEADLILAVKDKGNATAVNWAVTFKVGERKPIPHAIH